MAAGEALLGRCLEFLSDVGGTYLVGRDLLRDAQVHDAPPPSATASTASRRSAGSPRAPRELGVQLGVEVVNRYETNVLNTAAQASASWRTPSARTNVVVHLDTYHMNIEEPDMCTPVLDAGSRLGYVHIGESHRGYLGSGTVDFDSFFRALATIGYDGPVVFESFSSAVVHPDLSNMLGIWRNLWQDGDDLGRHANSYIRNQLAAVASIQLH